MRNILSLAIFIFAISVFAQNTTTTTTVTTSTGAAQVAPAQQTYQQVQTQPILSTSEAVNRQQNINTNTQRTAPTYGTPVSPEAMKTTQPNIQGYPRTTTTTLTTTTPTTTPRY